VRGRRAALAAPLAAVAAYAVLGGRAAWTQREWINPDAVCYLRNALYWTQGRFHDAVSGYWSPLLSLCVAPWLALGFDPVHAAAAVLFVWGALFVVATSVFAVRAALLPPWLLTLALLFVADATLRWGTTLFPDVILATCLMAASAVLIDRTVVERRRRAVVAGLFGGLGYLSKAYGFPFFVVFLPLSLAVLHGPWTRSRSAWRPVLKAWGWGMVGFAAVAAPWVTALSLKLGHPTTGAAGPINHAIVGPRDPARDALWTPVAGRITVWEIPETRDYAFWSPLEGAESFRWQARIARINAKRILIALTRFDRLALSLIVIVLGPLLAWRIKDERSVRWSSWVSGTVAVFCTGFVFVYYDYRYTAPFLKPLAILAVFASADAIGRRFEAAWARPALLALTVASFALQLNVPFTPYLVEEPDGTPFNNVTIDARPHRALASELAGAGFSGPIASSFYWGGMFTAYFGDSPFVGLPPGQDAASVEAELARVGAKVFLVDPAWPLAGAFAARATWTRARRTEAAGQAIDVFVPAPAGASR
jgi:hypothetical protein